MIISYNSRHYRLYFGPRLFILLSVFVGSIFGINSVFPARADDWPQWRGIGRQGVWRESGIVSRFPKNGLLVRWRSQVGPGYSGPVVAEGRVFVTDRQRHRNLERVLCLDERSGQLLWVREYEAVYKGVDYDSGPRAAPTVDSDRVYTLGTMGHLLCLKRADGSVIWKKDFVTDYKTEVPLWGIAGAPLVEGELLIANVGGKPDACLVAFDKFSGREVWRALSDRGGYGAPIVITASGTRQLIFWSAQAVNSVDPKTGRVYWRIPYRCQSDLNVASPVQYRDLLLVSSFYEGAMMMKLDADRPGASILWKEPPTSELETAMVHCLMSAPYFKGDHFYAVDSYGELRCLEISTGKRVWETLQATGKDRWSSAQLTPNGDQTFLFNEHGELILAELSPQGYREISRTRVIMPTQGVEGLRPVTWAHPAYANRHAVVRNDEELISVSLADMPPQSENSGKEGSSPRRQPSSP